MFPVPQLTLRGYKPTKRTNHGVRPCVGNLLVVQHIDEND